MFDWQRFLDDVSEVSRGDYSSAFKLLGVVLFMQQKGIEPLLSGKLISPRTAYRWLETIQDAGWGSLLSEVRVMQAIRQHLDGLQGVDAGAVRDSLAKLLDTALDEDVSRLCPHCRAVVRRADEQRGQCSTCKGPLLSLTQGGVKCATF